MTPSTPRPRTPGTWLLTIARFVFDEPLRESVIEPTISDFQREMTEAGTNGAKRLRARWRAYRAFWTLVLMAPFTAARLPGSESGAVDLHLLLTRTAIGTAVLTVLTVFLAGEFELQAMVMAPVAVGAIVAFMIHAWNNRHPSVVAMPIERRSATPQINFSSTGVPSNVGGLIFVVGTVFIALGLPLVTWFLFAAFVAGCFLARALVVWHAKHPKSGLPEGRIAWR